MTIFTSTKPRYWWVDQPEEDYRVGDRYFPISIYKANVSPYLLRPLRTLAEAQADIAKASQFR